MNPATKTLFSLLFLFFYQPSFSQDQSPKKYPSLLWEISGNGLSKPSYLYGTMHVSSKVAFHLGDSFYYALENVDAVALESRPDKWLEEMIEANVLGEAMPSFVTSGRNIYGVQMEDKTYAVDPGSVKRLGQLIASDPSLINHFLYRLSRGEGNFEESTFLDLFIFQIGRKQGKEVYSLEEFQTMLELVEKAQKRDYTGKKDEYLEGYENIGYGDKLNLFDRIADAYRKGDLDMLDSLQRLANPLRNYHKYMLWERNRIMVERGDSLMKHGSLFMGVGAAHLPGREGMIELLREMGYTVRPVMPTERNEKFQKKYENKKVSLPAVKFVSSDGFITTETPGRMIELPAYSGNMGAMLPEMVHGAYYIIQRIPYLAAYFGEQPEYTLSRIDSLLYEHIPGDIIQKKSIVQNGYPGIDISNKTRRGNHQRYRIVVTPTEILLFKVGGMKDYATQKEATRFFDALQLKGQSTAWQKVKSDHDDFEVEIPGYPFAPETDFPRKFEMEPEYFSCDPVTGSIYFVLPKAQNYKAEHTTYADTFLIRLALRSFAFGEGVERKSQRLLKLGERDILEWVCTGPQNSEITVRSVRRGGSTIVYGVLDKGDPAGRERFLNSFSLTPVVSSEFIQHNDTNLHATYHCLELPKKSKYYYTYGASKVKGASSYTPVYLRGSSPGGDITVYRWQLGRYDELQDSLDVWPHDSTYRVDSLRMIKRMPVVMKGYYAYRDTYLSDTGTTRVAFRRVIAMAEADIIIETRYDSVDGFSEFQQRFLDSFVPKDTMLHAGLITDRKQLFWDHLLGTDSSLRSEAFMNMQQVDWEKEDAPRLVAFADTSDLLNSKSTRNYYRTLLALDHPAVLEFFERKYAGCGDTASLQLKHIAYMAHLLTAASAKKAVGYMVRDIPLYKSGISDVFMPFKDSLELVVPLVPDLMKLSPIEEYKPHVYQLVARTLDSVGFKPAMLSSDVGRLLVEARIQLRRVEPGTTLISKGTGSELQSLVHILFLFRESDPEVKSWFAQLEKSDKPIVQHILFGLYLSKGIDPPASIVEAMARQERTRIIAYEELRKKDRLDIFPKQYKNQDSLALSLLKAANGTRTMDSVHFLAKDKVVVNGDTGYIYYYRVKDKYGSSWSYTYVGIQPMDSTRIETRGQLDKKTLGVWSPRDNVAEKISTFSEFMVIQARLKDKPYWEMEKELSYEHTEYYYEEDDYDEYMDY